MFDGLKSAFVRALGYDPDALSPLFQSAEKAAAAERLAAAMRSTFTRPEASYATPGANAVLQHGWSTNELIYACVSKTASTASQVETRVRDRKSGVVISDHPLKQLLQRPNAEMSEFDFLFSVTAYQLLFGRAVFEKQRDASGRVIGLWPLRPDWLKIKYKDAITVDRYEYVPPGKMEGAALDPADVLHFRMWDPRGLFSVWPPVYVALRAAQVDNDATDLIKATFQDGGTPTGLLKTTQRLRDDDVDVLRRRWRERYGGWKNWLDPAVLGQGAEFQRIAMTFKELGFDILDERSEARICMVLDVPPILVGAKVGLERATYSNYAEARKAWWQDSLMPRYMNMNDVLLNQLASEFSWTGDFVLDWDFSRVPAFQEEQSARWDRALSGLQSGGITVNEFRAQVGLAADPTGNVYLRNGQTIEVPSTVEPVKAKQSEHTDEPIEHKSGLSAQERNAIEKGLRDELMKHWGSQLAAIEDEVAKTHGDRS